MHTISDLQRFLLECYSPENLIVHPEDFLWLLLRRAAVTCPRDAFGPYIEIGATKVRPASPVHDFKGLKYFNISDRPRFADNCERQENQKEKGSTIPRCSVCSALQEWVTISEYLPTFPPCLSSIRSTNVLLCTEDRTHSRTEEWLRAAGIAAKKNEETRP